jgi:diguanylate cyclase (GGDEF)-like protein/PAS domain S-box-containing protein
MVAERGRQAQDGLVGELRSAASSGRIGLAFQPQVTLRTGDISCFEALARWDHPSLGQVSPDTFIPMAEEVGLIGLIGRQVLEQACREATGWPDEIAVAVNVSALQFRDPAFPALVGSALEHARLKPLRLELEVTESTLLVNDAQTQAALHALRNIGVRLVVDDLGVGYSSLSYLTTFPFTKVKIDRSFVSGIGHHQPRGEIVKAIIGLSAALGMGCVAEGIETKPQYSALMQAGCGEGQGRLISPPVAAGQIPDLLSRFDQAAESAHPRVSNTVPAASISFFQIAETANDIIIVTTPDLEPPGPTIVYVNPAFTRLTGYEAVEAIGQTPRILQGPGTSRQTLSAIKAALEAGRTVHEKVLNYAKCGAPYWLDIKIVALRDASGIITHFAAIERDVTMDKRRLDELEFIADRDTLTGIPNRRAFLRAVDAEIEIAQSRRARSIGPSVAFIDVDHFKQINDSLGHGAGDEVLFGMADRLAGNIRRSDILGRLGGEEFAVCMPGVGLDDAQALAERLRRSITSLPIDTLVGPVDITVSVGVASYDLADDTARLLKRADGAMYAAKRAGRDQVKAGG